MPSQSTIPFAERFWSTVDTSGDCWLWTGALTRQGYGRTWKDGKTRRAHRMAWELENGPIPTGLMVLHRCDNPRCVRPDHLFLGTAADNMHDMYAKGRALTGDQHPTRHRPELWKHLAAYKAKLTEDDVRTIRARAAAGELLIHITEDYPVNVSTISKIVRRQTWAHID